MAVPFVLPLCKFQTKVRDVPVPIVYASSKASSVCSGFAGQELIPMLSIKQNTYSQAAPAVQLLLSTMAALMI